MGHLGTAVATRNLCDEGIRVAPLVGDDKACRLVLDQRSGLIDIGDLSGREDHTQRIAQGVDGHMQLGRQSAPRTADLLTPGIFWRRLAVSVSVLVTIVKKSLNFDASLYTLLQILSVSLFEKMPLQQAFPDSGSSSDTIAINNQFDLFAF
ncbi:MAG: hypothetical protein Q8J96_02595 [Rhodocyclaceae bacterium]|nr:hypothetical protein [Rhodocyclaceae bacterium]